MRVIIDNIRCISSLFFIVFLVQNVQAHPVRPPKTLVFDYDTKTDALLYQYLHFYIDSTEQLSVNALADKYEQGKFHQFDKPYLNIGLNPYPLWIAFPSQYTDSISRTYWWSFYTHADSIYVYQLYNTSNWKLTDILSFQNHVTDRIEPVRFLILPLKYKLGEKKMLMAKVLHKHHPQNFTMSFTTAKYTLFWERDFYWTVGIFVGLSVMVFIYSIVIGLFSLRKIFFIYAGYLLAITLLCLNEEILTSILPIHLFRSISRLSNLHIALLCLNLSFYTIAEITRLRTQRRKLFKGLNIVVVACLLWTLLSGVIQYIFYDTITVSTSFFIVTWNVSIVMIGVLNFCIISAVMAVAKKTTFFFNILAAVLLLYFNAGGYFLNYEGILKYYEITYPNFFYWVLLAEYVIMGTILSWQYSQSIKKQKELTKEKAEFETLLYQKELVAEKRERQKLAQDLHDELATDLSAIKLFVTNNYKTDSYLLNIVNKANIDVRKFLEKLSDRNITEKGLVYSLKEKTDRLNTLQMMQFQFYNEGDEIHIPNDDYVDVFWIANELLTNVLKHSQAKEVTLQLLIDEGQYTLIVEDDGIGIDVKAEKGMGLKNIQARVNRINATLHTSANNHGTTTILTKKINDEDKNSLR